MDDEARFLSFDAMRQIGLCLQAFNVVEALVEQRLTQLVGAPAHRLAPFFDSLAAREKFSAYRRLVEDTDGTPPPETGADWFEGIESLSRQRNAIAHGIEGQDAPGPRERARFAHACDETIVGLRHALQTAQGPDRKRR